MTIILTVLLVMFGAGPALASQAMPQYGVNDETGECAFFFTGDECTSCSIPPAWRKVPSCPEGVQPIKDMVSRCKPHKTSFCCTVAHSGSQGDCEDTIVHLQHRQCAFVEDMKQCAALPDGWQRVEEDKNWGRACPSDYEWLEEPVPCE